jgi:hypothetical protein
MPQPSGLEHGAALPKTRSGNDRLPAARQRSAQIIPFRSSESCHAEDRNNVQNGGLGRGHDELPHRLRFRPPSKQVYRARMFTHTALGVNEL